MTLLLGCCKAYRLFVGHDHRPRTMRRGLGLMALSVVLQAAAGLGLVVVDSFRWLTTMMSVWPEDLSDPLAHLLRTSALATVALIGAIVSALIWFLLSQRVVRIEIQNAQLLLQLERSA
jgi:hypothetical protein